MTNTRILPLRIPDDLREQVRRAADDEYTTMTAWIISAIVEKLRYEQRPDVIAAREEYNRR